MSTPYQQWIDKYASFTRNHLEKRERALKLRPRISLLMPVHDPEPRFLTEAIKSVVSQVYENWELCLVDDASTDERIKDIIRMWAKRDRRIVVHTRERNGHICRASNDALQMASGIYSGLVDHDDVIPDYALLFVVEAIQAFPQANLIYSDEDKLDENGLRCSPYFKPDFNEHLIRGQNMISHFGVYRTALLRSLGGFRVGYEGSQDHDLALRVIDASLPSQIVHIPRVLYHWRMHANSTAASPAAKSYAVEAGVHAVQDHLDRNAIAATVSATPFGYRVAYRTEKPLVSLIVPTRNGERLVRNCIESIRRLTAYPHYEIILVDNGSDDQKAVAYFKELDRLGAVRLLRDDGPFNYSAINNRAVRYAQGEIIGLVNNDIEVRSPNWLDEMVSLALQPNAGAIGAKLYYPDGRIQHAGVIAGIGGVAAHAFCKFPGKHPGYFARMMLVSNYTVVTAACLLVRKRIFEEVAGLDENIAVAFNDVDLCLKIHAAGYRNAWTPYAELIHHESATRGRDSDPVKIARFRREHAYMRARWGGLEDPCYSPNLTLNNTQFMMADPPRDISPKAGRPRHAESATSRATPIPTEVAA